MYLLGVKKHIFVWTPSIWAEASRGLQAPDPLSSRHLRALSEWGGLEEILGGLS